MSIEIAQEKCVGCGICAEICPGSLFRLDADTAEMKHPENCWGCASCVKECPAGAFRLYLGGDIGGKGGRLSVRKDGALLNWTVEKPDGTSVTLTVDSRNANNY
jgi:adenylylsulfate reductase subunit B